LADPTGQLTDTYTYDAYGLLIAKSGTTVNHYLYRGEPRRLVGVELDCRRQAIGRDEHEARASQQVTVARAGIMRYLN
jgi:hypothetical protein